MQWFFTMKRVEIYMKKINIVKKKQEFSDIIHSKIYTTNKLFAIYYRKNSLDIPRFGITVSKKIGTAVVRNKIKRQLKNIIDKNKNLFPNNLDYIIIVRGSVLEHSFSEIEQFLINLINKTKWR